MRILDGDRLLDDLKRCLNLILAKDAIKARALGRCDTYRTIIRVIENGDYDVEDDQEVTQ